MEEKIKIYIPNNVYQTLLKDMELFEFFKKDHSLNKNEFLNKLIVNYYQSYAESNSRTYEHIKDVLEELGINSMDASSAASNIVDFTSRQALDLENKKLDVVISMKPTKVSSKAFDYIENFLLNGSSLSGWLRNLFASYSRLPQDKREHIIFKENFDAINEALEKNRMLYFLTNAAKNKRHTVCGYALSSSKEELFNYLLVEENGNVMSYRVSRIFNVTVMTEECTFKETSLSIFQKMIQFGPQFSYSVNETEPIRVRFTDRGKMMYDKMYLHRPAYSRIDGDVYTFECSINQAMQYFQRFGKNAIILSPAKFRNDFETYYNIAYRAYHKQAVVEKAKKELNIQ